MTPISPPGRPTLFAESGRVPGHLLRPRPAKPAGLADDIGPRLQGNEVEPAIHELPDAG